jgi:diaminopimelate epimerase
LPINENTSHKKSGREVNLKMIDVPFSKFTSFGNNFVLVDESREPILTEAEKKSFAYFATDGCFGIGSDNFLVVQPCNPNVLGQINDHFGYWSHLPQALEADFIFRMFEPDGTEALSCGNGLMCIARHLSHAYGIKQSRILTQIPTSQPKPIQIGVSDEEDNCYADLGEPLKTPEDLVCDLPRTCIDGAIEKVDQLVIKDFRKSDEVEFLGNQRCLTIDGYLVFTGEPHFVIFVDEGLFPLDPVQYLFSGSVKGKGLAPSTEKRMSTGRAFINFVGNYFNSHLKRYFPKGISVNFVQRPLGDNRVLEYRCFERGIRKETLACGTGALACATVFCRLMAEGSDDIFLWPYLCRVTHPDSKIRAMKRANGWRICGDPVLLVDGVFSPKQTKGAQHQLMKRTG